jgi:hypothetical protein
MQTLKANFHHNIYLLASQTKIRSSFILIIALQIAIHTGQNKTSRTERQNDGERGQHDVGAPVQESSPAQKETNPSRQRRLVGRRIRHRRLLRSLHLGIKAP